MENNIEKIVCMRKFFLRFFILSLVFLWVLSLAAISTLDWQINTFAELFKLTPDEYSMCVLMFISIWKLFVIQFTLLPTLALWWLEKIIKN